MEYFVVWLVIAVVTAIVARSRGRSGIGWFFLGCLITIFALVLVALLPSLKRARPTVHPVAATVMGAVARRQGRHVPCPWCKEFVLADALVCKCCGLRLGSRPKPASKDGS